MMNLVVHGIAYLAEFGGVQCSRCPFLQLGTTWHRNVQIVGLFLGIIGFVLALAMVQQAGNIELRVLESCSTPMLERPSVEVETPMLSVLLVQAQHTLRAPTGRWA